MIIEQLKVCSLTFLFTLCIHTQLSHYVFETITYTFMTSPTLLTEVETKEETHEERGCRRQADSDEGYHNVN